MPVDGVFLAMHGAMLAEGVDDATGDVLEAVRNQVGDDVPVVATLDLVTPCGNDADCDDGTVTRFSATVRIDTPIELDYYRNGGILQTVLRKLLKATG